MVYLRTARDDGAVDRAGTTRSTGVCGDGVALIGEEGL